MTTKMKGKGPGRLLYYGTRTEAIFENSIIFSIPHYSAILLATIAEKLKKCLDFSATLFLINLFVCSIYGCIPAT